MAANFQETVIAHSLYKGILECVEKHISEEVLVEVALEIFIILSLNSKLDAYKHVSWVSNNNSLQLT